jgi:glycine/D-amino acid oxidase-like deaminating enzyme/nitrite reductase/ring-hydroxylating ferredoxin subunit
MSQETYWKSAKVPQYAPLPRSSRFDVAVVGAGITGLTAAYLLKQAGKKVCVLERARIAAVDTGNTTAHLTCVTDTRLTELVRTFGKDKARLTWQAGLTATDAVEHIARTLKIDCSFRRVPGFLHAALDGKRDESKTFQKEAELARELGFTAEYLDHVPLIDKPGIRFADQAKFHPVAYLAGLAKAVHGGGSQIFEQTEVDEVEDAAGDRLRVKVGKKHVDCGYLVIATHVPLAGKTGLVNATVFQSKLFPYSSYVVGAKLTPGKYFEATYWDTSDPYYYLRIDRHQGADYAIFGGEDHKTGQEPDPEARYARLEEILRDMMPRAQITHRWSGQVIETNDGLPYIGETAEGQFAATGYAGNGTTFGTLAGMMARDAVLGRENPWQDLFSVNRKKLRGGLWNYVSENVDYPYYMVRDRLARAERDSPEDVGPGEGKVLKLDGQRVACARDDQGQLSLVSAVCTHMGCLVRWNGTERTWDCPCHGSRFHPDGQVLAGPAESPLSPVKPPSGRSKSKPKAAPPAGAPAKKTTGRTQTRRRPGSAAAGASRKSGGRQSRQK